MYVARNPYKTDLHALIRENYRQVFFDKEVQGSNLPFNLEREFKKYLTCGIPSYGMGRLQCPCCLKDKFVAFSCKGRTICPSCTGRRTADTAKHLLEEVIPAVAVRQWVLSMPYSYRFLLSTNSEFLRKALSNYHRTINLIFQRERVFLKLKKPYSDGTTHLQFSPEQFIKRVIALIPPPRQNLIRYVGVFGARHNKRAVITALAKPKKEKVKNKTYRTPWAELLKHVFKYEVSDCEHIGHESLGHAEKPR